MKFRRIKGNKNKHEACVASSNIDKDISSLRAEIVKYAIQFKGNPYEWGGTSLTKGSDCSGFIQSIFNAFIIFLVSSSVILCCSGISRHFSSNTLTELTPASVVRLHWTHDITKALFSVERYNDSIFNSLEIS